MTIGYFVTTRKVAKTAKEQEGIATFLIHVFREFKSNFESTRMKKNAKAQVAGYRQVLETPVS